MKKLLSTLLFLFVVAILSLSAQNRIYPPTLLEPENEDDGQMPDVVLNWAAVGGSGGIVEYEVQIDTNASFANPTSFPKIELSGLQMSLLLFDQQYFWRVRSWEGTEHSDWSDPFLFTTFDVLTLSKPNDGADEQDPNVEFKLKDRVGTTLITGVEHFYFQADTSMDFNSPLLFEGNSETFTLNAEYLHFGETYYWRAKAMHSADETAWSELRTFSVWPFVELDEPSNNSSDMGLENLLVWDEIPGVIDYTVQVADNDAFTGAFSMVVEGTEYTTDGYMHFGIDYFWRVRANHATDTSDWSEAWEFSTTSTVHLSSPDNDELNVSINPLLEWDEITGVDYYHVQYNITNNFDEPCCDEPMIDPEENFLQVVFILDYETKYYWRARTMKGIDTTEWSNVWSFTTRAQDYGIDEAAFGADNINIYPNPSHGILHLEIAGEENSEVSIHVMDLLGQIEYEASLSFGQGNSNHKLDLNNLANGLYILKLTRGNQTYSHKITIHK